MARKQPSPPRQAKRRSTSDIKTDAANGGSSCARGGVPASNNDEDFAEDELSAQVIRGCLIARDAVFNVRDFFAEGSRWPFSPSRIAKKNSTRSSARSMNNCLKPSPGWAKPKRANCWRALSSSPTWSASEISPTARPCNWKRAAKNCRRRIPVSSPRWLHCFAPCWSRSIRAFLKRDVTHAQSVLQSDPGSGPPLPFACFKGISPNRTAPSGQGKL